MSNISNKLLYSVGCAVGGGLVGLFANKLTSPFGAVMFAIGVVLITFCTYNAAKKEK